MSGVSPVSPGPLPLRCPRCLLAAATPRAGVPRCLPARCSLAAGISGVPSLLVLRCAHPRCPLGAGITQFATPGSLSVPVSLVSPRCRYPGAPILGASISGTIIPGVPSVLASPEPPRCRYLRCPHSRCPPEAVLPGGLPYPRCRYAQCPSGYLRCSAAPVPPVSSRSVPGAGGVTRGPAPARSPRGAPGRGDGNSGGCWRAPAPGTSPADWKDELSPCGAGPGPREGEG